MPIRVELIDEAVEDLVRYAESGNLPLFLKKLLRLEEVGKDAGRPLGGGLTRWRKIVVGDRDWRIIFTMDAEDSVATVWVIGARDDSACYAEAQRRLNELSPGRQDASTLAGAMYQISEMQRTRKRTRRRPR